MEDMSEKVFRKNGETVERAIAGETFLVPIRGRLADMQKIFSLNASGKFIWDNINGIKSLREISEGLQAFFDVTKEEACTDLESFIAELQNAELIVGVN